MKRVGIIGLGDMGIAMARNIIKSGFELTGFDLREERLKLLEEVGGKRASTPAEVGSHSDAVFVMVLHGHQVDSVVSGENGAHHDGSWFDRDRVGDDQSLGSSRSREVRGGKGRRNDRYARERRQEWRGGGTLTMMAVARKDVFENHLDVLGAVGE